MEMTYFHGNTLVLVSLENFASKLHELVSVLWRQFVWFWMKISASANIQISSAEAEAEAK